MGIGDGEVHRRTKRVRDRLNEATALAKQGRWGEAACVAGAAEVAAEALRDLYNEREAFAAARAEKAAALDALSQASQDEEGGYW